jgi:dipeptidyl aminopeptidase/acylaminoacyl peptidase
MRRVLLLVTAILAVPASAQADTLLSVPAAGGRPTEIGREAGTYFSSPCWRTDGALMAQAERSKRPRAYGVFRTGARPRWQRVEDDVIGAEFAPGCALVAEVHYAFGDDPQYDGGVLIRETGGKELMRVQSRQWPEGVTLTWSRDGTRLAISMYARGGRGETVSVVDVPSRRVLHREPALSYLTLRPGAFSPDGNALVYEDGDRVRILDIVARRSRQVAGGADGRRLRVPAWSPTGDRIAAVNDGGGIELIDPALGYGPTVKTAAVWTESLTWSPDGATLALQFKRPNSRGPIERYGLGLVAATPEGRLRRLVDPVPNLSEPIWSPDGTALAVSRRG